MRYLIYSLLAILSFLLFFPTTQTPKIRNVPLLAAVILLLCLLLLVRATKRIINISKIKKALRENGFSIKRSSVVPNFFALKGRYDIRANRAGTVYNIVLLRVIKASLHCHFESVGKIEYYISTHAVVHGGRNGLSTRVTNSTETRCIKKVRLPFEIKDGEKYVLILDKLPARISDTASRELFAGDMIEGKVLLLCADRLTELTNL